MNEPTQMITTVVNGVMPTTSKGGKSYHRVDTAAGMMSCWNAQIAGQLMGNVGKQVNVHYSLSGDRGQYKTIQAIDAPTSDDKFMGAIDDRNANYQKAKDGLIVRQVAAKAAVDLVCAKEILLSELGSYAQKIQDWIDGKQVDFNLMKVEDLPF